MKTLISSSQSGIINLEKEFLLGDNFFSISFDLSIEINSKYFLSLSKLDNTLGFIWTNDNNKSTNFQSIIESDLLLNTWNSIKFIYIPAVGVLFYKNKTLVNTFKLELNQDFYKIKVFIDENSKIRNLIVNPEDSSYKLILHGNNSMLDSNIWSVRGLLSSETSNNSHFGKSLKLFFGTEISFNQILYSGVCIDKSDFTFDFYIQASTINPLNINLFSKYKKQSINLIKLEFVNKKLSSLILKDNNLDLNISISNITHFALVYHHNLNLIYLFVNGIFVLSSKFSISKKDYYFINILSQGIFNLDELHFCSGLAYWINNFTLSKYPYKNSTSINNLFIPNSLSNSFIASSSISYVITANFLIKDSNSILIEILWKSNQFPNGEFIPFSRNIFQINSNNYFSHKSDLIELAESNIHACEKYLNNLIGVVTLPNNISEVYLNKFGKSINISVEFIQKIINQNIQYIEFKIFYELNNNQILFRESNFKITSENYMNYTSELSDSVDRELEDLQSYLDSISNKILHLGNSKISLVDNNSILLTNTSITNNYKNLRLNLQEKN